MKIQRLKDCTLILTCAGGTRHVIDAPVGAGRLKYIETELGRYLEIDRRIRSPINTVFDIHEMWVEGLSGADFFRQVAPPAFAEWVMPFLAPENSVQSQLGDLHEMFQKNAHRIGERQARRKYWKQVARSIIPALWQWLKRISIVTVLLDVFRSKAGL